MPQNDPAFSRAAFTLVELLIVMALLVIFMALAAPSLSRSLRQRRINDEASRLLALTEYARSEAVSQGVPMVVWLNSQAQQYGTEPAPGFTGEETRNRVFTTNSEVDFDIPNAVATQGVINLAEFAPDGAPDLSAVEAIALSDKFDAIAVLARTEDGWGYEVAPVTP